MAKISSFRSRFLQFLSKNTHSASLLQTHQRNLVSVTSGGIHYTPRPKNFQALRDGWPYHRFYDRTHNVVNENSKIISVEGNVGVGKYEVAKKLADLFDMNVTKDTTEEDLWVLHGFRETINMLEYNEVLPESARYYTREMFWNDVDPIKNGRPLNLQYRMFLDRYYKYCKALCETMNTGKGFFMDRGPHSDYIMAKSMLECGLMSQKAYDWYYFARRNTVPALWKPHVVIYLRAPVDMVRQKIKERNMPGEVDARNLTDKFLHTYQKNLEDDYLTKIKDYSEVVHVDLEEFDIDDDNDMKYLSDRLSLLDLEGVGLDDLDKKFHQWKDGTHNRDALDLSRAKWSCMPTAFMAYFSRLTKPLSMREGRYSYEEFFMQHDLLNRDPRTDFVLGDDPDVDSTWQRLIFGPKIESNYNFDAPKLFFWS